MREVRETRVKAKGHGIVANGNEALSQGCKDSIPGTYIWEVVV